MQIFEILPNIGMGPIKLGMSKSEVQAELGNSGAESLAVVFRYFNNNFQVAFDSRDKVEFIGLSLTDSVRGVFNGSELLRLTAEEAIKIVSGFDSAEELENGCTFAFQNLNMSLWRDYKSDSEKTDNFLEISLGVKDYFKAKEKQVTLSWKEIAKESGNKLAAIKAYKTENNCGMTEAKKSVEEYISKLMN